MRRRYVPPTVQEDSHREALRGGIDLVAMLKPGKKRRAPRVDRKSAIEEAKDRISGRGFSDATPGVIVALYCCFHERVYGQWPIDVDVPAEWRKATVVVAGIRKRFFDGSSTLLTEFMLWAWQKEEEAEKWRRQNGREGTRLLWQYLFNVKKVVEYRLNLQRSSKVQVVSSVG
jgi:hypothetical protein